MSWNTGVIYIVLFVTPFFFLKEDIWYIYIYICGWHLGPSGARISWFMGNLDQPLTRSDVLITSADGSRVFLGKRKALPAARVCWKRGVSMDPNLWKLGVSSWPWETLLIREIRFPFSPFPGIVFFLLGASSTGLASWPIQIRFMVLSWATEVEAPLVGFFRWGFGGRAKPGESPQEAVCLVRIFGERQMRGGVTASMAGCSTCDAKGALYSISSCTFWGWVAVFFSEQNCNLDWTWCNCENWSSFFFAFHGLDAKGCFCMFFSAFRFGFKPGSRGFPTVVWKFRPWHGGRRWCAWGRIPWNAWIG